MAKYLIKKQTARKIEKIFKVKFNFLLINFLKLKNISGDVNPAQSARDNFPGAQTMALIPAGAHWGIYKVVGPL